MLVAIPDRALIILIGPSGSGKSTFARRHFKPTEILSSDHCRALVADDPNDQSATLDAFAVLHCIARKRLAAGRHTVIDATNVKPADRKPLLDLANRYSRPAVAIVFDLPAEVCAEHDTKRADRHVEPEIIARHIAALQRSLPALEREGFRHVYRFHSLDQINHADVQRAPQPPQPASEHDRPDTPQPQGTL